MRIKILFSYFIFDKKLHNERWNLLSQQSDVKNCTNNQLFDNKYHIALLISRTMLFIACKI